MSLQSILGDIDEKKKACIDGIRKDFDTKKGELVIASEKRISDLQASYERKITDGASAMRAREMSIIDLEEKRIILERRNRLVEDALKGSEDALVSLTKSKEYKEILLSMFSVAKELLGDKVEFYLTEEDLKGNGSQIKGNELTRAYHIPGGLVATSHDGKMELDFTLDTIFREIREDLALELETRIKEA